MANRSGRCAPPRGNVSTRRAWRPWARFWLAALVALPAAALEAQVASAAAALQRHGASWSAGDLAAVERGDVVAKVLPTADARDVAVLGIVRLDISRDAYVRRTRDLRSWLQTPTHEHVGLFSLPATLADVGTLEVSGRDVDELRRCRPGDCSTKLSAGEMLRVQGEIDWTRHDVVAQVTRLARQRLVRLVDEYREQGNAALPTFADRPTPVRAADVADAVQAQSVFLQQVVPALARHLRTFPRDRLRGVTDTLYWAESVVPRLRPIVSLTHTVIHAPADAEGVTVIASKQLYANHYFEGALELYHIAERVVPGEAAAVYVVVERRYRFDNLPRGLLNIRGRATSGLREQLVADLRRERAGR